MRMNDSSVMWFGHMNGGVSLFKGEVFQVIPVGLSDPGPVTYMGKSNDNADLDEHL